MIMIQFRGFAQQIPLYGEAFIPLSLPLRRLACETLGEGIAVVETEGEIYTDLLSAFCIDRAFLISIRGTASCSGIRDHIPDIRHTG